MIICYTVPEIWCVTDVIIFHFGPFFALLSPNSPKNQNSEKMKKTPGDIIILHMCTRNYDQMMYSSGDMVRDRCNCYFSFWTIFCPFTPLTAQKIKVLKKTLGDITILHMCTKNYDQIFTVPEICCATDGRTDGRTDGKSEVGAPPKNLSKPFLLDTQTHYEPF